MYLCSDNSSDRSTLRPSIRINKMEVDKYLVDLWVNAHGQLWQEFKPTKPAGQTEKKKHWGWLRQLTLQAFRMSSTPQFKSYSKSPKDTKYSTLWWRSELAARLIATQWCLDVTSELNQWAIQYHFSRRSWTSVNKSGKSWLSSTLRSSNINSSTWTA